MLKYEKNKFCMSFLNEQEETSNYQDFFTFAVPFVHTKCIVTHGPTAIICGDSQICVVRPILQTNQFEQAVFSFGDKYSCKLIFAGYLLNDYSCYICIVSVKKDEQFDFV